jgi:hypothetical protein
MDKPAMKPTPPRPAPPPPRFRQPRRSGFVGELRYWNRSLRPAMYRTGNPPGRVVRAAVIM